MSQEVDEFVAAFKDVPTSIVSDNLKRLAGPVGLRPFHRNGSLCGNALTVRTRSGDNKVIHEALELIKPGDVVVVDGGGDTSRALVGEIMKEIAEHKGAAGFIIDGAVRDSDAFAAGSFPCFARAATHHGPYKFGPGEINVPISVGGHVVSPNDIVLGDMDGVVSFSRSIARDLLDVCRNQIEREAETIRSIREGKYSGSYSKSP